MSDKNKLYKCIYDNITKLVKNLRENNEYIFKNLINKDVFINDLVTCKVSIQNATELSNLLNNNPNTNYSLYNNKIDFDNFSFNFSPNYKTCISDSILKYSNFVRDTKARNI